MNVQAPIVLFAYARPHHIRRTLTALSAAEGARASELWVFSDGPRNDKAAGPVAAVRALLAEPLWREAFAHMQVIEAPANLGLANSIISGVTRVLEHHDRVIVLEDDLLVAPDFLSFMNDALSLHVGTPAVGSITGYCPLPVPPPGYSYDVYAVPRSCSHSWATWRDRWERVDWSGRGAALLWNDRALRARFEATGTDKLDRLRRQLEGRIDSWSILFNLWHALEGRYAIYPVRNLVQNIGFDGSGTHTRLSDRMHTDIRGGRRLDPAFPPEDPRVLRAFKKIYSGSFTGQLRRMVRNWPTPSTVRRLASD